MHAKQTIAALIAVTVLAGTAPVAADSPHRPQNGMISFGRFDPELGDFSIWTANPDGTKQRQLTRFPASSPTGHPTDGASPSTSSTSQACMWRRWRPTAPVSVS